MEFISPTILQDGLAMYDTREGDPLLLMPYPRGFSGAPIMQGPLAAVLREQGLRVVSIEEREKFKTVISEFI